MEINKLSDKQIKLKLEFIKDGFHVVKNEIDLVVLKKDKLTIKLR